MEHDRCCSSFECLQRIRWTRSAVRRKLVPPRRPYSGSEGANGAGKTTLLRLILGAIWPDTGEIRLWGEPSRVRAAERRQRVHFVAATLAFLADGGLMSGSGIRGFRTADGTMPGAASCCHRWI